MGNWQSLSTNGTGQSRTHNAQNQVTGVGSATLAFDANGSMTTDQSGNTFVYDAWNRLVKAVDGSSVSRAEYAYDALSRRIVETRPVASTTDHLYYSTGWQVLEERRGGTASSDVRHQYLWSIDYVDAMVARVGYSSGSLSSVYEVAYDANWNVTAIAGGANVGGMNIQERYVYDPYGAVTILAPNGTVRGSSSYDWKYLQQTGRLDGDSGLYHFRNRDYSATLGRWTQTDPIGFNAGDTNLYRYVGNGPVNGVDPWGLQDGRQPYPVLPPVPGSGFPYGIYDRPDAGIKKPPKYTNDQNQILAMCGDDTGLRNSVSDLIDFLGDCPAYLPWPYPIGTFDRCMRWKGETMTKIIEERRGGRFPGITFGERMWPYDGWVPTFTDHGGIEVTLKNGCKFYLDNGLYGGYDDHIFIEFPDELKGGPRKGKFLDMTPRISFP